MANQNRLMFICTAAVLAAAGAAHARPGPDVIVGDIPDRSNFGVLGGKAAWAIGTTSCNIGDQELIWTANTNQHPVISQNLYRLSNGRFEQIGQAWLKHGFCALQGTVCSSGCQPSPLGCGALGILCSDPYSSGLNGDQGGLGPKSEVNASSGAFPYPFSGQGSTGNTLFKRLQADVADIGVAGATYYVSSMYVQPEDAQAHNNNNNESYRPVSFSGTNMNLAGATQREKPGIQAWKDQDPSVTLSNVDVAADGRFIVGSNATLVSPGVWRYEYAVQNLNSHRSGQGFSIPIPAGAVVSNVGFHDVDYHSGEPYSSTDWAPVVGGTSVSWSTQTFAQNANANALRWDTIYNFRFDCDQAPGSGSATIALFRTGAPSTVVGAAVIPGGGPPPPPSNDLCSNATSVGNGVTTFSNVNAASEAPTQNACGSSNTFFNDVWYQYSSPCSGDVAINLCGASFDTKLAVYTACPAGDNSAIACNDDSDDCGINSLQSSLSFSAAAGTTYFIRLASFNNGATGFGNMTIAGPTCGPVGPVNDNCAAATVISSPSTPFDNTGATTDGPDEPASCNFFGDTQIASDIWYRYTAPCSGDYTFSLCGSSYDTEIALYPDSCPTSGGSVIACNDDFCGVQSELGIALAAGSTYLIRIGGYQGAQGTGTINITAPMCAVPGETCAAAVNLPAYGSFPYSNADAATNGPNDVCASFGADIWFSYTACASGMHTLDTCTNNAYDSVLVVYTGGCNSLTQVACNDDGGCGVNGLGSALSWDASAGTTYFFRVGGYNGETGHAELTLAGPSCGPVAPPNDNCQGRAGIALGQTPFTTIAATTDGPSHAGCETAFNDVWFNYPSMCNGALTVDTCTSTGYDSVIAVYAYNGTCADISDSTLVACNDDACGLQSSVTFAAHSGQNYAVRIGGYQGATGTGTLTLTCMSCPCDWDHSGSIGSQDFFDFLAGFFNNNADYNTDGQTTSQDFFDFLNCFLAPPVGC